MHFLAIIAVRWLTVLPPAPAMTAASIAALADPAPAADAGPSDTGVMLKPDSNGLIDVPAFLAAQEKRADAEPVSNPFRRRFHPPGPSRDNVFQVSALMRSPEGSSDCCIINGAVMGRGEMLSGLLVRSVEADGVVLCDGRLSLYLPLQDDPTTVRLPR